MAFTPTQWDTSTACDIEVFCLGRNEDQLYVTSAHCGACGGDADRQERYPDSGNLFVVNLGGLYTGGKYRYEFAG